MALPRTRVERTYFTTAPSIGFLRPPSEAIYSKEAIGAWLEREYAGGSQLECVQLGGDAMLLPEGWGHATLNLEASIGVTWELSLPGTGLQSAVHSICGRNYLQGVSVHGLFTVVIRCQVGHV